MLYFEKADKVSSTSSTHRCFPIKLLQHAGHRAGVVIPVEGVAGTISIMSIYFYWCRFHTGEQYSITGLTRPLYAIALMCLFWIWRLSLRNPRFLFALAHILVMRVAHVSFDVNSTPKYVAISVQNSMVYNHMTFVIYSLLYPS